MYLVPSISRWWHWALWQLTRGILDSVGGWLGRMSLGKWWRFAGLILVITLWFERFPTAVLLVNVWVMILVLFFSIAEVVELFTENGGERGDGSNQLQAWRSRMISWSINQLLADSAVDFAVQKQLQYGSFTHLQRWSNYVVGVTWRSTSVLASTSNHAQSLTQVLRDLDRIHRPGHHLRKTIQSQSKHLRTSTSVAPCADFWTVTGLANAWPYGSAETFRLWVRGPRLKLPSSHCGHEQMYDLRVAIHKM